MYYCKIYMHSRELSRENIISILEKRFGRSEKAGVSYYKFRSFDISISKNDEYDPNKLRTYPDGFIYYEMIADIDVFIDPFPVMNDISEALWDKGITAVISCDDEDELNRYIFRI